MNKIKKTLAGLLKNIKLCRRVIISSTVFFGIVAFLFTLTGCGNKEADTVQTYVQEEQSPGEPEYGDTIIVPSIGDARNLIPILAYDGASADIVDLVFNGLIKYDKDINLTGDLARSWDISEDGLEITFYLRKGVKWHDGRDFTARDVKFTYEKLIDPQVPTPYGGDFKMLKSFEVLDDYTVRVTYKEPFSPGLSSWGMSIMPEHLLRDKDLIKCDFARNPVGTGPYRFISWKTGDRIILEYNPDYFEGRPYIDKYIYRIIPDEATIFLELQNLSVDYTGLTPMQFSRQTNTPLFKKNYNKYKYPYFGYTYLAYNLKDPKFKDKRVRQAINYALDKQEIINGALLGLGRVCTGPFPAESWAYNPNVTPFPYDILKAGSLLAECGWSDSDNDNWVDKEGQKFEFTITTNQGNTQRQKTAEIIQWRLAKIGIKVNIKIIEWSVFINNYVNKRNFEAVILSWSLTPDPDPYDIWHSSKTKEGEFNVISYNNPEVDELLIKGRRTFDKEERTKIYHRIHEILHEEQPYTFLYLPESLPIANKRFKGIKPAPLGIEYNFIKWYVPESQQKYIK